MRLEMKTIWILWRYWILG